eukprot:3733133-Pyramimonas_sp.AAC.1
MHRFIPILVPGGSAVLLGARAESPGGPGVRKLRARWRKSCMTVVEHVQQRCNSWCTSDGKVV